MDGQWRLAGTRFGVLGGEAGWEALKRVARMAGRRHPPRLRWVFPQ
jgi:hypothetical protein